MFTFIFKYFMPIYIGQLNLDRLTIVRFTKKLRKINSLTKMTHTLVLMQQISWHVTGNPRKRCRRHTLFVYQTFDPLKLVQTNIRK